MKRIIPLLFALCLVGCEGKVPSYKKHQPADPSTWSPVGHKYVSIDEDYPDRAITFVSKDSILWLREGKEKMIPYKVEYPYMYLWKNMWKWLVFQDTLTINRRNDTQDEALTYIMEY